MIAPKAIKLSLFRQEIEGRLVTLTPALAGEKVMGEWWGEDCLKNPLIPLQIDRYWNWNTHQIEYDGRILSGEKVAAVTGENEDLAVQGAIIVSTEFIESVDGRPCLLVEFLFTAPRNRPVLRKDGRPYVVGVGTQLMIWAAWLSREMGFGGRLRLDGSPEFVAWYEKRGLQKVGLDPIVFEDVEYTPMELSEDAARKLLEAWEDD